MPIIDRRRIAKALPGYTLGEELGAGAYGLVLAARHRRMRRPVAVKVMATGTAEGTPQDFTAEARVLAGFDHPHVVRAYDYIEAEGLCLVVMELLAGGTLTRRRIGMDPQQACAVGLAVAAALDHAHSRGVLHRDIKTDNILFAADDTVKVTDFGIAKLFDGSAATASGFAGTPMYSAPEQIEGGRIGPATDLYALGVVLYQLLTGTPPFDPAQPMQALLHQHLTIPPRPMTGVAEPITAVVLRALAKRPSDRHPDIAAFALDLARAATDVYGPGWHAPTGLPLHLSDELRRTIGAKPSPVGADDQNTAPGTGSEDDRPAPNKDRSGSRGPWRRRPVLLPLAVATLLTLTALVWRPDRADGHPPSPEAVSGQLATAAVTAATAAHPDLALARRLALAAYRTAPTSQARTAVLRLLTTPAQPLTTFTANAPGTTAAVFSPDGKLFLSEGDPYGVDPVVRLWDTSARGSDVQALATLNGYSGVFSPDGKLLATTSSAADGTQLWDTTARGPDAQPLTTLNGYSGVFSPDGKLLATRHGPDGGVRLWDTTARGPDAQPLATLAPFTGDMVISPDGKLLATNGLDGDVRLWDTTARGPDTQPLATLNGTTDLVSEMTFSPDGKLLTINSVDGTVWLWDTTARGPNTQPLATLAGNTRFARDAVFSPDGKLLAANNDTDGTHLWDTTARGPDIQPLATLSGNTAVFSPDGKLLATSSSADGTQLWDTTARGPDIQPLAALNGYRAVFSPDGKLLAASGGGGVVRLWHTTARGPDTQPPTILTGDTAVFSPDGKLLTTNNNDGSARLWEVNPDHLTATACTEKANELTEAEWKTALPEIPYDSPCS